jgi:hypothetical protein
VQEERYLSRATHLSAPLVARGLTFRSVKGEGWSLVSEMSKPHSRSKRQGRRCRSCIASLAHQSSSELRALQTRTSRVEDELIDEPAPLRCDFFSPHVIT